MYKIKVEYTTGDSAESYRTVDYIEFDWESLSAVTQSLERIKIHYDWYLYENGGKYYKKHCIQPPSKPPYTHPKYDRSLELVLDNNKRHYTYAFWCGSFETLHKVSIEVVEPELSQFIFEW